MNQTESHGGKAAPGLNINPKKGIAVQNLNVIKPFHPFACIFHVVFKIAAGLCFMFMGLFTRSQVTIFVTVLLLSVLDFWITKNVTGRLLIGLRWWSSNDISSYEDLEQDQLTEEEEEKFGGWHFESYNYDVNNSMIDSNIFWFGQGGITAYWGIFVVLKTLGLSLFWVICKCNGRECSSSSVSASLS